MYTNVRGEGVKRDNWTRAALSEKWERYGSELRRGGGDHEQRQKRVWGAKHYNEAAIAAKLHKRPHRCRAL